MAQRSAEELARLLRGGCDSYSRDLFMAQGLAMLLDDLARREAERKMREPDWESTLGAGER